MAHSLRDDRLASALGGYWFGCYAPRQWRGRVTPGYTWYMNVRRIHTRMKNNTRKKFAKMKLLVGTARRACWKTTLRRVACFTALRPYVQSAYNTSMTTGVSVSTSRASMWSRPFSSMQAGRMVGLVLWADACSDTCVKKRASYGHICLLRQQLSRCVESTRNVQNGTNSTASSVVKDKASTRLEYGAVT